MAIRDIEQGTAVSEERRKIPGVDHPVRQTSSRFPNGRDFQSETFTTPLPDRPRIYPEARVVRQGFDTMISVNVEPCGDYLRNMDATAPYEESYQYFNRTSRNVKITNKHNVTWTVPRIKNNFHVRGSDEYFIVRKVVRINSAEVAISILTNHHMDVPYLAIDDQERIQLLSRLNEDSQSGALRSYNYSCEMTFDRIIPLDLLHNYASMYVSDLDLTFRMEQVDIGTPHPTSQDAQIRGEIMDFVENRRLTGMFFEIVDNDNRFTNRYVCMGKTVMQVPIHRDDRRDPGIYFTDINNVNAKRLHVSMNHLPLERAEEIGIYKTKEEAATNGHVTEAFQQELLRLRHDLQEREAEITRVRLERDEEHDKLQHERRLEASRLEIDKTVITHAKDRLSTEAAVEELTLKSKAKQREHVIEGESLERKAHYEVRSLDRKDTSEIIKWAPTLITGGLALATAATVVYARMKPTDDEKGGKGKGKGKPRKVSASEIGFEF